MNEKNNTRTDGIDTKLVGINGWLVLPAISLIVSPFLLILGLITLCYSAAQSEVEYLVFYIFAICVNIGLLCYVLVAANRFFHKQKNAPETIINLAITAVIAEVALILMYWAFGPRGIIFFGGIGEGIWFRLIVMFIWILYFKVSKRVEATFVNIRIKCPNCNRKLRGATEDMVGETGVCPKCKTEFEINS